MGSNAALGVIGLAALAAVGFGAGRAVPSDADPATSAATTAPPQRARVPTPRAAHTPLATRAAEIPTRPPAQWVDGRRVLPSFRAAFDADQATALRTRSAVIAALEARRRAHDDALRACFAGAAVDGLIAIAFDVDVRSRADVLEIGDARFGDVIEGPALEPSVAACLEPLLAGESTVPADDVGGFLAGYDDSIDYVARFTF